MRPLDQLHTVTPATPVMEALETMGRDDVNQLPVMSDNHLEGIVTRANVLQFLQTRSELGQYRYAYVATSRAPRKVW